jgi:hypothetical protein
MGTLRGYDVRDLHSSYARISQTDTSQPFMNIVLDEAVEEKQGGEKVRLGMVIIRGNSVVMMEALERIGGDDRNNR